MSVINRMLQELESRHEQPQDRLPGLVRAVPPERNSNRRYLLFVVATFAAAVLAVAGVWAWRSYSTPPNASVGATLPSGHGEPVAASQPPWPQPLQAPTERLVSETALLSRPTPVPRGAASPSKARDADAMPQTQRMEQAHDADAAQASASLVVKSAPSTAPEAGGAGGIKQVSSGQRADQFYREALALRSQGRMGEAQTALEEALRIDPRHLGARQALLGMFVDGKRYAQAEQVLQDGLALNLAPPVLAMALARLQIERGDQATALLTLEHYLPQAQDNADYRAFYAALLQRGERHAEAIAHYQAALRGQPNRALWWMGLGISLQAEKRGAEAEQAFSRARATPGLSPELQAFVEQRLKQLQ